MELNQDKLHIEHWEHFFSDEVRSKLYPTWWNSRTVNHWRHQRFLEAPAYLLKLDEYKEANWLTIGDGSGHDTWMLRSFGAKNVLTTDIGTGVLSKTLKEGHITRYEQANAERLQYDDSSFDVVLCKEALHHMQRPYAAIYEMLRVSRELVIIVEPQDKYIDLPCLPGPFNPTYESVGNFVYGFSAIEMQKICFGLNLAGVATKNLIDIYVAGCEFEDADEENIMFIDLKQKVEQAEKDAQEGVIKWNYILSVIFKSVEARTKFSSVMNSCGLNGWYLVNTDTNPHL